MATIGFFPLQETSHINATFGLAKQLQARGHRVCYLAPLDFEEYIRVQGLDFIPFSPTLFPKGVQQRIMSTPGTVEKIWERAFGMLCNGELDEVVKNSQFDLLVVDTWAQQMALIAYKVGVPTILLSPTLPAARDIRVPPTTEAIVPDSLLAKLKVRLWWYRYDLQRLRLYLKNETAGYVQPMKTLAASANYPLRQLDTTGIDSQSRSIRSPEVEEG
jgi:UDP:flavonoid glycosyltransferase YjiC (YdhE family)